MIVLDTGPLVAANERDDHHQRCLDYLEAAPGPLIVPAPVVIEVCYFLGSRRGLKSTRPGWIAGLPACSSCLDASRAAGVQRSRCEDVLAELFGLPVP